MAIMKLCNGCGGIFAPQDLVRGRCRDRCARAYNAERNRRPQHQIWNSPAWKKVRRQALERDGYRCRYREEDGGRCTATEQLSVHHVQALAEGGALFELENLVTLCDRHHGSVDRLRAVATRQRSM